MKLNREVCLACLRKHCVRLSARLNGGVDFERYIGGLEKWDRAYERGSLLRCSVTPWHVIVEHEGVFEECLYTLEHLLSE